MTILDGLLFGLGWILASIIFAGAVLGIGLWAIRRYEDKEEKHDE